MRAAPTAGGRGGVLAAATWVAGRAWMGSGRGTALSCDRTARAGAVHGSGADTTPRRDLVPPWPARIQVLRAGGRGICGPRERDRRDRHLLWRLSRLRARRRGNVVTCAEGSGRLWAPASGVQRRGLPEPAGSGYGPDAPIRPDGRAPSGIQLPSAQATGPTPSQRRGPYPSARASAPAAQPSPPPPGQGAGPNPATGPSARPLTG